jgi:hypothetical protein
LAEQATSDPGALAVLRDLHEEATGGQHPLAGKPVLWMGLNFMFAGRLLGFTLDQVVLENPILVYDTGEWDAPAWATSRPMGCRRGYFDRGGGAMFEISEAKIRA